MASLHCWFKGLVVKRAITRDNTVTQSAIRVVPGARLAITFSGRPGRGLIHISERESDL